MSSAKSWGLLLLSILVLTACTVWPLVPAGPMPEALAALESDAQVQVETEPWLVFQPTGQEPGVGLILYPGARVDARAYAPPARAIAAGGYLVVVTPMPQDLAILAPDRAAEVMTAFPTVRHWAVGGHSMGGAAAAIFAHDRSDVEGLVLWASYPGAADDLSGANLITVSIYGTQDGWTSLDEIDASRRLLPPGTRWVVIEGGNHAQFGWYGPQIGDTAATISREEQQAQTIAATLDLLARLEE
jgi:pimeloyl-ACP methyl ester carboxylesterase